MRMQTIAGILLCGLMAAGNGTDCQGAIITLNATDSGSYISSGFHDSSQKAYVVSTVFGNNRRNYFSFNLASVSETITSAFIRLANVQPGTNSATTFSVFNVSTATGTVSNGHFAGAAGVAIYNDLGTGTNYGSLAVGANLAAGNYDVTLNASAISSLDSATGLFVFGGSIGGANTTVFANTVLSGAQLVLTTQSVPEPSTLLALSGIAMCAGVRRLRRRAVQVVAEH